MNILKKYIIRILCIIIFNGLFSLNVSVNANSSEWVYNESGQVLYLYEIEIDEVTITAGGNLNDIIIPNYVPSEAVDLYSNWLPQDSNVTIYEINNEEG